MEGANVFSLLPSSFLSLFSLLPLAYSYKRRGEEEEEWGKRRKDTFSESKNRDHRAPLIKCHLAFGICLSSGLSHSVLLLFTRSKLFGTEAGWDLPCGQFGYSDTLKIYRWLLDLDWREDVAEAHFNPPACIVFASLTL